MSRRTNICVSVDRQQLEKIDSQQLTKDLGRSATFRLMIHEFFERRRERQDAKRKLHEKEN